MERKIYKTVEASKLKQRQLKEAYAVSLKATGGGQFNSQKLEPVQMSSVAPDSALVKHFYDGYLDATVYEDSLSYTYDDSIVLIKAERMEDRKFFLWKWVGWKKKINRDMVEIVAANPNSKINGRMIKLGD